MTLRSEASLPPEAHDPRQATASLFREEYPAQKEQAERERDELPGADENIYANSQIQHDELQSLPAAGGVGASGAQNPRSPRELLSKTFGSGFSGGTRAWATVPPFSYARIACMPVFAAGIAPPAHLMKGARL